MASKKNEQTTDIANVNEANSALVVSDQLPEYLRNQQGQARGQENVGAEDLVIPRLEVVQDLSPCRKKSDPNYIEGAESGMLYNSVTRELYGESVIVVPVGFVKEWLLWKDREKGGGFRGAFPSEKAASEARSQLLDADGKPEGDDVDIVDTNQQFCILIKADGTTEEIVVSMAKSKAKVSRKWNSLIRIGNGDSFSRAYRLQAVEDKNNKNQSFYNFGVAAAGFPSESVYRKAEKMYEAFVGGNIVADRSADGNDEEPATTGANEY